MRKKSIIIASLVVGILGCVFAVLVIREEANRPPVYQIQTEIRVELTTMSSDDDWKVGPTTIEVIEVLTPEDTRRAIEENPAVKKTEWYESMTASQRPATTRSRTAYPTSNRTGK